MSRAPQGPSPTELLVYAEGWPTVFRYSASPSGLKAAVRVGLLSLSSSSPNVIEAVTRGGEPGMGVRFTVEELQDATTFARPLLDYWRLLRAHYDARSAR